MLKWRLIFVQGGQAYNGDKADGIYASGKVRAKIWKACSFLKPDRVEGPFVFDQRNLYKKIVHGSIKTPDLVVVKVELSNGWVSFGQGSAYYQQVNWPFGGVLFSYDNFWVEIWVPMAYSNPETGSVFNAYGGWGTSGNTLSITSGSVSVWLWWYNSLPSSPNKSSFIRLISVGVEDKTSMTFADDIIDNSLFSLIVRTDDDKNFYASGTAPSTGNLAQGSKYGGIVFGYTLNTVYYWYPNDVTNGCLVMTGGVWGNGESALCENMNIKMIFQLDYFDSPSIETLPCRQHPCTSSNVGPMCNCTGTGKTGQYCLLAGTCTLPSDPINATFSPLRIKYKYQQSVSFSCLPGYVYTSGNETATCNNYLTWTGERFICAPVDCGQPSSGTNSDIVRLEGTTFRQGVFYQCTDGTSWKSGNSTRLCNSDGHWSGNALVCAESCGEPPTQSNTIRTNVGNTVGTTAEFVCEPGYEQSGGDTTITCDDLHWEGEPLECTRKSCGMPERGVNCTYFPTTETFFQDEINYTCNNGHIYKIDWGLHMLTMTVICQEDGKFSKAPMDCEPLTCAVPEPGVFTKTKIHEGNIYRNVIEYQCVIGKMLTSGSLHRECQENGLWSGQPPVCDDVYCPEPIEVENGFVDKTGIIYLDFSIVVCNKGYQVANGDAYRKCQANGTWSGQQPRCESVDSQKPQTPCPQLPEVENATLIVSSYAGGHVAVTMCNAPLQVTSGSAVRFCLENGNWNGTAPICQSVDSQKPQTPCPQLPEVENATLIVSGYTGGHVAVTMCDAPLQVTSGSAVRFCLENGNWNGTAPICQFSVVVTSVNKVPTPEELAEEMARTEKQLRIDKKSTLKYKRSLESANFESTLGLVLTVVATAISLSVILTCACLKV